jgi:hypothetical protein
VLKSGCAHHASFRWTAQDHTLNLDWALILWKKKTLTHHRSPSNLRLSCVTVNRWWQLFAF